MTFKAFALACCALLAAPLSAQQIAGYSHRHWGVEEGSPANIQAMAQTRDGFLWLGTSGGLYRFDGMGFEKIEPEPFNRWRSKQITALAAAPDGALWVGYDFGGVGVYRDGHLRDANAEKRPGGSVISIAAGPDGDIWITANSHGKAELRQFHKGRWIIHTPANGLADEPIQSVFVARDGAVWIAQYPTLLRLSPGAQRPEKVPVKAASAATFAQDAAGAVWLAGSEGLRRLSAPYPLTRTDADMANANPGGQQSLLFEDGSAWLAGHEEGLILLHSAQRRETVKVRSVTLLRDREGTIWGGGPDGLVSYIRSALFRQDIAGIPTSGFALSPAPDHPIYVGTQDGAYEIAGGQARMVLRAKYVSQICPGPAGTLWVSSSRQRYFRRGGVWTTFAHGPAPGYTDTACAMDSAGNPWVSAAAMGIHHLDRGIWHRENDWPAVESIVADGAGGLYANRPMQAVMHLTPGHVENIWAGDAMAIGFIRTIKRIGPYLYMGGEKGLARYDGKHITVVEARNHPWLSGITGLAIGARDAWVITSDGIMRMAATDLDRVFDHPERPLPHQAMGQGMGVGSRSFAYTANDAEIDAQGQAWFVTDKGLFRVDPARSERNPVAPPVTIRALLANGVRYRAGDVTLSAGTSRIQLDFVALSLTAPARNLYRYRLDGVDEGWVDAGPKRQANYTGLGPGEYHFRVIAANSDGVWNREGAVMTITIKPWFWQTWWFRGAMVVLAAVSLWALVQWRIRAAAEAARRRIEDRMAVREHIAQDLHDTLLQGFQGLVLRFQSTMSRLPPDHAARREMEATLDRADDVLQEGRDRVRFLREENEPVDLAVMLSRIAGEVLDDRLRWLLKETGEPRPICAPVAEDVSRIAGEAMFNALRHAHGTLLSLRIDHTPEGVTITLSDNGTGLDPAIREKGRTGHYGLVGMRERAARLGAGLSITDAKPSGTTIRLTLPARLAYR